MSLLLGDDDGVIDEGRVLAEDAVHQGTVSLPGRQRRGALTGGRSSL